MKNNFKIRFVIVKKYDDQGVKISMYKYWMKQNAYTDDIYKAHHFESFYTAEYNLKFTDDTGIFQIEKIYIK